MPDEQKKHNAVRQDCRSWMIGLGGSGSSIVRGLQAVSPSAASYLTLDHDSEIFRSCFDGFMVDVLPPIREWARSSEAPEDIHSWLGDLPHQLSPLQELPDIFLRNTTRSVMRAALLQHITALYALFEGQPVADPEVIVLVANVFGSTGTAWVGDIAEYCHARHPYAKLHAILVNDSELNNFWRARSIKHETNAFWILRESLTSPTLLRATHVVDSIDEAAALALGLLSRRAADTPRDAQRVTTELINRLVHKIVDSHGNFAPWIEQEILGSRCRRISECMSDIDRFALAGAIVAGAERRIVDHRNLTLRSSDGEISSGVCLVGHQYWPTTVWLALTHNSFGNENQKLAYESLLAEGRRALTVSPFRVSAEGRGRLLEFTTRLSDRLAEAREDSTESELSALIRDLYPELMKITESILENAGGNHL